ncbi:hypothetical protein A2U01_0060740, partial [Trifolium medium]|nr:hypothetical protein [Trifolium medium]
MQNLHNFPCSRAAPSALRDAQLSVTSEEFEFSTRRAAPHPTARRATSRRFPLTTCFTGAPRHTRLRDVQ